MTSIDTTRGIVARLSVTLAALAATTTIGLAATQGFPFTEDFTDTLLRDASNTTADWGATTVGELQLGRRDHITGGLGADTAKGGPALDHCVAETQATCDDDDPAFYATPEVRGLTTVATVGPMLSWTAASCIGVTFSMPLKFTHLCRSRSIR